MLRNLNWPKPPSLFSFGLILTGFMLSGAPDAYAQAPQTSGEAVSTYMNQNVSKEAPGFVLDEALASSLSKAAEESGKIVQKCMPNAGRAAPNGLQDIMALTQNLMKCYCQNATAMYAIEKTRYDSIAAFIGRQPEFRNKTFFVQSNPQSDKWLVTPENQKLETLAETKKRNQCP